MPVAEIDASVSEQVARSFRLRERLEVRRRTHNRRTMVFGDTDRDHVLLNILAELDARVEAAGHNIAVRVVGCDIEDDVRIERVNCASSGRATPSRQAWAPTTADGPQVCCGGQ